MSLPEERVELRNAYGVKVGFVLPVYAFYVIVPVLPFQEDMIAKILLLYDVSDPECFDAYTVVEVNSDAVSVLLGIF